MKTITIILILSLSTILGFGQTNDLPVREAFNLKMAVNDSIYFYNLEVKATPYFVHDNIIQIYPGEKIYVEVELIKNEIKSMKTVKENLNPEKTIIISFSQETEGKKHKWMMLSIKNPFNLELKYEANIFLMKLNQWQPTSVLAIKNNLESFETWPDIITSLSISGWIFK
jgi:hypothetical protein